MKRRNPTNPNDVKIHSERYAAVWNGSYCIAVFTGDTAIEDAKKAGGEGAMIIDLRLKKEIENEQ